MSFEAKVFDAIKPSLQAGDHIELYNGTLFLDCSEKTARTAFSQLFTKVSTWIQISRVGPDSYAIDFVEPKAEEFSPYSTVNS